MGVISNERFTILESQVREIPSNALKYLPWDFAHRRQRNFVETLVVHPVIMVFDML